MINRQERLLIGKVLEAIRIHHGYTLENIHAAIQVPIYSWSRTENGQRVLKFAEACAFCDFLKITIGEFHTAIILGTAKLYAEGENLTTAAAKVYSEFIANKNVEVQNGRGASDGLIPQGHRTG